MTDKISTRVPKSTFEEIKEMSKDGLEHWSARDLAPLLGYKKAYWRYFEGVIKKAKIACEKSKNNVKHHFVANNKMVNLGSGSERTISDYSLTRYACYLIAQNGNPNKKEIAEAQTYFAIKTHEREQEEKIGYIKARREKRDKLTISINVLNSIAKQKGVINGKQFADFTDAGTKGLYGGLTTIQVKKRKNIPNKANLQDRMGLDELTANNFAKMLARREIEKIDAYSANKASEVNFSAHDRVREDMKVFGKTMPEDLPVEPDIDIAEKRLKDPNKAYCKNFNHNSEKVLEIHLPDKFSVQQRNELLRLLKENHGTGSVMLHWSAQDDIRLVSFGVNCSRDLSIQVKRIFNRVQKKMK